MAWRRVLWTASRALRLRPGEGIPGQALATMAPVLVEDAGQEPRFLRREAALASGYVAVLCTPLIAQGKPVGTLQLYASAEHRYSAELLPLVQAISEQLAVAIANAHLHQSVRASEVGVPQPGGEHATADFSPGSGRPLHLCQPDPADHVGVAQPDRRQRRAPARLPRAPRRLARGRPDPSTGRGDRSRGGVPFAASRWQLAVVSAHGVSVAARR